MLYLNTRVDSVYPLFTITVELSHNPAELFQVTLTDIHRKVFKAEPTNNLVEAVLTVTRKFDDEQKVNQLQQNKDKLATEWNVYKKAFARAATRVANETTALSVLREKRLTLLDQINSSSYTESSPAELDEIKEVRYQILRNKARLTDAELSVATATRTFEKTVLATLGEATTIKWNSDYCCTVFSAQLETTYT